MGWFNDEHPGHEGYIVGLVPDATKPDRWRELGTHPSDDAHTERRVERFKVGCECGWRSRVFRASLEAIWSPSSTDLRDDALDVAVQGEWHRHLEAEAERQAEVRSARLLVPVDTWT